MSQPVDWRRRYEVVEKLRLSVPEIESIMDGLKQQGLTVADALYKGQMGGGWYIEVLAAPSAARVAFDGRDGFLYYERKSNGRWEDVLVFNPDIADAEVYTAASILRTLIGLAV